MKVLFFTDTHGNERLHAEIFKKAHFADMIVCAGDFTIFENDMPKILRQFDNLEKPFLIIHGNHETASELLIECQGLRHVKFIHKNYFIHKHFLFVGYGGGGFSSSDSKFDHFADQFMNFYKREYPEHQLILILHQPPFDTTVDDMGWHVGNTSFRKFIDTYQPLMAVSGHIHETFGAEDTVGKTKLLNPGPEGKIIEL
ncbi:MAG: metallophosphoesterase [Candidatus Woesearchaeota archaeon]